IFFHFNNKSFNYFNYSDDQIMVLLKKNIKNSKIIFIDHSNFMDYLFLEKEYNKNNYLLIKSKPNRNSYYKIFYPNQNRESFGQLSEKNDLIVKYKKDIFIDISNIFSIDYIIFNGKKYKNSNENRYYLKNFDINKLNEL
ncbi:MAG: hypothetical protein CMI90_06175, partial [Pelagibacteraceae bacterium]|nr:hypothetical protein [Pelagibacteraceae bacterium]